MSRNFIILFICFFAVSAKSQTVINLSATESTCENNGTITVTASNGTPPYTYTLTTGPTGVNYPAVQTATDNIFFSLPPGIYSVEVEDATSEIVPGSIEVPGTYIQPTLALSGTDITCPAGLDGTITATPANGLSPFTFEILSPIAVGPQSSNLFTGLAAGVYQVRAYDQCGNFQTRNYTLVEDYPTLNLYRSGIVRRVNCDSVYYRVGAVGGKPTYTYEVISPITTPQTMDQDFYLPDDHPAYIFQVTDACGNTATLEHKRPSQVLYFSNRSYSCSGVTSDFSPSNMLLAPYVLEIVSGPTGPMVLPDLSITDFPFGSYTFQVTDSCGNTAFLNQNYVWGLEFNNVYTQPSYCIEGAGRLFYTMKSTFRGPLSFSLVSYPADFTGPITDANATWDPVVPGTYIMEVEDACGETIRDTTEIVEVLEVDFVTDFSPGCVNDNSITAALTANRNLWSTRYNLNYVSNGSNYANNFTGIFNNLPSNDFYVEVELCTDIFYRDTFLIPPYVQPNIDPLLGVGCGGGTVSITSKPVGGVAPYTYELLDPSLNIVEGPQSSALFVDVPTGVDYRVRIVDACGNSSIKDVSFVSNLGFDLATNGFTCEGEVFSIIADSLEGVSYNWEGPNSFSSSARMVEFEPLDMVDEGMYSVTVTLPGCASEVLSYDLEVVANASCNLQVALLSFSGEYISRNKVQLDWVTASELNNDHFELMRSKDGINWEVLAIVEGQGTTNEISKYNFSDKDPFHGNSFYQLKQVDLNGETSLSEIVIIKIGFLNDHLFGTAYPNPSKEIVYINVNSDTALDFDIKLFTLDGKLQQSKKMNAANRLHLNTKSLPAGIYILQITSGKYYTTQKLTILD